MKLHLHEVKNQEPTLPVTEIYLKARQDAKHKLNNERKKTIFKNFIFSFSKNKLRS